MPPDTLGYYIYLDALGVLVALGLLCVKYLGQRGSRYLPLVVFSFTTLPIVLVTVLVEHRAGALLRLVTAYPGLVMANLVIMPAAFTLAALAWRRHLAAGHQPMPRWWFIASVTVTIFTMIGLRTAEVAAYTAANAVAAVWSPAKLANDFLANPVLIFAALYLLGPILVRGKGSSRWYALGALGLFVLGCAAAILHGAGVTPAMLQDNSWVW